MRNNVWVCAAVVGMQMGMVIAGDGTWTNKVGGNWSHAANWFGGGVAGGFGVRWGPTCCLTPN